MMFRPGPIAGLTVMFRPGPIAGLTVMFRPGPIAGLMVMFRPGPIAGLTVMFRPGPIAGLTVMFQPGPIAGLMVMILGVRPARGAPAPVGLASRLLRVEAWAAGRGSGRSGAPRSRGHGRLASARPSGASVG